MPSSCRRGIEAHPLRASYAEVSVSDAALGALFPPGPLQQLVDKLEQELKAL